MNKEDIKKTRKYFRSWPELIGRTKDVIKPKQRKSVIHSYIPTPCRGFYSHRVEEFRIVIMNDDTVYQLGTECDTTGIRLETFEDLKIRFKIYRRGFRKMKKFTVMCITAMLVGFLIGIIIPFPICLLFSIIAGGMIGLFWDNIWKFFGGEDD